MDLFSVEMLSRLQFAVAVFFHFIFVPLTLGLSVLLAVMQTLWHKTGNEQYKRMVKFWGRIFLINFAVGIVTGITLEFQFGTNWSRYSAYVGAVFGPLLAVEAKVAFFLESTFIAVWHFGWSRINKKLHLASIWLVALAGNLSALWILLANGWMHNPVGFEEVDGVARLTDFFAVLTNPYAWGQFVHTILGSWTLSGFFVLGIAAWHLARGNEKDFFTRVVRLAAPFTLAVALLAAGAGHMQGNNVARYQPAKLAAMEAQWETMKGAPLNLITIPSFSRESEENLIDWIPLPGVLSFMAYNDFEAEVKGLRDFPREDRPPVMISFLSFRLMVGLGGLFILLALLACRYRKNLGEYKLVSKLLLFNIPLPYLALALGWMLAEVGRQPWIVYGKMRTADAVSPVPASSVGLSLAAFIAVYSFLGLAAIWLMRKNAMNGPMPLKTSGAVAAQEAKAAPAAQMTEGGSENA